MGLCVQRERESEKTERTETETERGEKIYPVFWVCKFLPVLFVCFVPLPGASGYHWPGTKVLVKL